MKLSCNKILLLSLILLVASPVAYSDQNDPIKQGAKTFKFKCAACHGEDAKGKSASNIEIKTDAPDLTTISKKNNGQFPFSKVYAVIDGREGLEEHGTRAMPIWGDLFLSDTIWEGCSQVDEQIVRGRILELILYLDFIQE